MAKTILSRRKKHKKMPAGLFACGHFSFCTLFSILPLSVYLSPPFPF